MARFFVRLSASIFESTMETYFVLLSCLFLFVGTVNSSIDTKNIELYGPGLHPVAIVMPARYFFVDFRKSLVETDKESLKKDLSVSITGQHFNARECRIWVNILDRKDGFFIVRYKLYEHCENFKISITFRGSQIGNSPYIFKGIVVQDECYCPETDFQKWLNDYQCSDKKYGQIDEDLKLFPSVNFTSFRKEALKTFDHPGSMSVCNYVVVNNKIYRSCYGEHVGFKMFMDQILLSLSRKVVLPDMEFLVNLGDWPLMKEEYKTIFPLFSWCGSENTYDIVMPTYDLTESSLECMGRVSLDMLSVQGNIDKHWEEKDEKIFWRGRDSNRERLKLIDIARQNPDLINASLVNFFFFRDLEDQYGPKEKYVSFFKFFDYKYQLNLDGTVAAYRFPYLLVGNSIVFKQESTYYEHFYRDLEEYRHYVPIKRDLTNLVEQIVWAKSHDKEARAIADNGRKYAEENLLPQHIFCYYAVLLGEWSKRITSEVEVLQDMEYVAQPNQEGCVCHEIIRKKMSDEL